ncbi:Protein indeterminate-domain 2, partial [Mucuna pruriens]
MFELENYCQIQISTFTDVMVMMRDEFYVTDPNAEVIALSPTTLMATNRFVCEICNKGFQRDQNLQLHRRGHNLPWKLRQRASKEVKKRVYVCPEPSCVHHNPARALGDLTGIKKHYNRKHGEKKWKCDKCSKRYAVQSDWKAHQKTCGTREYKCDCGTIFSSGLVHVKIEHVHLSETCRRDSFITHRAFCDALSEENKRGLTSGIMAGKLQNNELPDFMGTMPLSSSSNNSSVPELNKSMEMFSTTSGTLFGGPKIMSYHHPSSSTLQLSSNNSPVLNYASASAHMSATALLHKAAQIGVTASNSINSSYHPFNPPHVPANQLISDMGMFTPIFVGSSDHSQGFIKNVQQEVGAFIHGRDVAQGYPMRFGVSADITTVHDFLGVGGATSPQKQQQQRLELEALIQQRLQIMNHFRDSALDKSIWDI